jgi:hypothetical protein
MLAFKKKIEKIAMDGTPNRANIYFATDGQLLKTLIQADPAFDRQQVAAMNFALAGFILHQNHVDFTPWLEVGGLGQAL